eukprot:NODE_787_length_2360_cov_37.492624_g672_i0.p1 GENE.NODE_787_length_2360_cov_37.492624_g672_i0~~NODE_787_length_2360_cov_37.492624_g672_i0.p1  ORF type:complete len:724 (-),score=164.60 NODE_787_length_2360_cov_37.492624_g672_i0:114-2285(-)
MTEPPLDISAVHLTPTKTRTFKSKAERELERLLALANLENEKKDDEKLTKKVKSKKEDSIDNECAPKKSKKPPPPPPQPVPQILDPNEDKTSKIIRDNTDFTKENVNTTQGTPLDNITNNPNLVHSEEPKCTPKKVRHSKKDLEGSTPTPKRPKKEVQPLPPPLPIDSDEHNSDNDPKKDDLIEVKPKPKPKPSNQITKYFTFSTQKTQPILPSTQASVTSSEPTDPNRSELPTKVKFNLANKPYFPTTTTPSFDTFLNNTNFLEWLKDNSTEDDIKNSWSKLPKISPIPKPPVPSELPIGFDTTYKLISFHSSSRPTYYGTFQNRSKLINGRYLSRSSPQDNELIDYDRDSEDEWEDPGDGEDLDDDGEEDNNQQDEEPDEEDDYVVEDDYLSADEGLFRSDDEEENPNPHQEVKVPRKRRPKVCNANVLGIVWPSSERLSEPLEKYKARSLWTSSRQIPSLSSLISIFPVQLSKDEKHAGISKKSVNEKHLIDLVKCIHGNPSLQNGIATFIELHGEECSKLQTEIKIREICYRGRNSLGKLSWMVRGDLLASLGHPEKSPEEDLANGPCPLEGDNDQTSPNKIKTKTPLRSTKKRIAISTPSSDLQDFKRLKEDDIPLYIPSPPTSPVKFVEEPQIVYDHEIVGNVPSPPVLVDTENIPPRIDTNVTEIQTPILPEPPLEVDDTPSNLTASRIESSSISNVNTTHTNILIPRSKHNKNQI